MSFTIKGGTVAKGTFTGPRQWVSYPVPNVPGYTYIPWSALPSEFTLAETSTGDLMTYNTAITDGNGPAMCDGGALPAITFLPYVPTNVYSDTNPGIWGVLQAKTQGQYVHHGGFVMWLGDIAALGNPYFWAARYEWVWAFFLKNGTSNQVKMYNPYPGDGVGYWVQSDGSRIRIGTQDPALATVYTMSTGPSLYSLLPTSFTKSSG